MNGNRWVVASLLAGLFFVLLVLMGGLDPVSVRQILGKKDPVETLFGALAGGILTGVTLVLAINQLVLSQELGAVSDQRQRMEGSMDYIRHVESLLSESVTPAEPARFLGTLLDGIHERSQRLATRASQTLDSDEAVERIQSYVDSLSDRAETTRRRLEGAQFGSFDVVSAALLFNYSKLLHEGRALRDVLNDETEGIVEGTLDDLLDLLQAYGSTREHFKTLYFQWELINLSKAIIYTGVPALLIACAVVFYLNDTIMITGRTLGLSHFHLSLGFLTTLCIYPFLILVSFILRIATVAKETLAMGPFILRDRTGLDSVTDS